MGNRRKQKQQKRNKKQRKREARRRKAEEAGLRPRSNSRAAAISEARDALRDDPQDCEILLVLAEIAAGSAEEHVALLRQAVSAGEATLRILRGKDPFKDLVRDADAPTVSSYLHARAKLGVALICAGRFEEGVQQLRGLMDMVPVDLFGARLWILLGAFELGDLDLVGAVGHEVVDGPWLPWAVALHEFAEDGPKSRIAQRLLSEAYESEPQLLNVLLGERQLHLPHAADVARGTDKELETEGAMLLRAWGSQAGALNWLHAQHKLTDGALPSSSWVRGQRHVELPQCAETWQLGAKLLEGHQENWLVLVYNPGNDLILSSEVYPSPPGGKQALAVCEAAFTRPAVGKARRPSRVEVGALVLGELAGFVAGAGVEVCALRRSARFDACVNSLGRSLHDGIEFPAWTKRPGVKSADVLELCEAANTFFEATPWQYVLPDEVFRITAPECEEFEGERYAAIMGQNAETYGLALYDDLDSCQALLSLGRPEDSASTAVTYDPAFVLNAEDEARMSELGWEAPGPSSHPLVFRLEGEGERIPVSPLPVQIRALTFALRGLAQVACTSKRSGHVKVRVGGRTLALQIEGHDIEGPGSLDDLELPPIRSDLEPAYREALGLVEGFFETRPELDPGTTLAFWQLICSLPESPIGRGRPASWAAGMLYAIFRQTGELGRTVTGKEIAEACGVSLSTARAKAERVDGFVDDLARAAYDE